MFVFFLFQLHSIFLHQCHEIGGQRWLSQLKEGNWGASISDFWKVTMSWQQKQNKNKLLDFWACNHLYRKHFLKKHRGSAWPHIYDHIKTASRNISFWQPSLSWAPGRHAGGQIIFFLSLCEYASCALLCHLEGFLFTGRTFKRVLKYKFGVSKEKTLKQKCCCATLIAHMKSICLLTFKGGRDVHLETPRWLGKVREKPKRNEQ